MKRFLLYCLVLVLVVGLFSGCTNGGNVTDEDGMIENSSSNTDTNRPSTTSGKDNDRNDSSLPSSGNQTQESSGGMGEGTGEGTGEGDGNTDESGDNGRSGRRLF